MLQSPLCTSNSTFVVLINRITDTIHGQHHYRQQDMQLIHDQPIRILVGTGGVQFCRTHAFRAEDSGPGEAQPASPLGLKTIRGSIGAFGQHEKREEEGKKTHAQWLTSVARAIDRITMQRPRANPASFASCIISVVTTPIPGTVTKGREKRASTEATRHGSCR